MDLLTGLHGSLATVVICAMLFVDEAGVPMPFAPNEIVLIVAGLLISAGTVPWFIVFPLAVGTIILGSFVGYSWAAAIGPDQIAGFAAKLHASAAYERALRRTASASPGSVAVARLLPGVRIYVTLVAGATHMPLATFLRGSAIAGVIWTAVLLALGALVGIPVAYFFSQVERLAISGALLIFFGVLAYRAARKSPEHGAWSPFDDITPWHRVVLAGLLDVGVVAVIGAGFDRIVRSVFGAALPTSIIGVQYSFLTLAAAIAVTYVIASRHGGKGETAGERMFDVSYVHRKRERRVVSVPVAVERRRSALAARAPEAE